MALKRIIVLAALLIVVCQTGVQAQERGPLVMQIEFEWTVMGTVAGSVVGFLVWLTDPANPTNNLSDSLAAGAAWGAFAGAGFGVYVLQNSANAPRTAIYNPLAPENRISADPVAVLSGESTPFAHRVAANDGGPELRLPLLRLHF